MRAGAAVVLASGGGRRGLLVDGARAALRLPLQRAQAAGVEVIAAAAGSPTVRLAAADAARFAGAPAGLLIEGERSNLLVNPRTPGSTGWTNTALSAVVAAAGPDGTDSAFLLTENTTTNFHGTFRGAVTTTAGTRYAGSVFVAPGTCDLVQLAFSNAGFGLTAFANFVLTGEGSVGFLGAGLVTAGIERIGEFYRCWIVDDAGAAVSTAGLTILFITSPTAARAESFAGTSRTMRLAFPQMEVGGAATATVLPPVGAPAVAARGADLITRPLAELGIGETGAGIYEATVVMPQAAPAGAAQSILEIEADAANRFIVRVAAGGAAVAVNRVTAGVAAGDTSAGNMTPGVPFRVRLTLPGDGTASLSLNGGAEVSVSGGPTTRLATLRIGNSAAGTTPMNGRLQELGARPGPAALRLGVPAGFGWSPPLSIYRAGDGAYSTDFDPAFFRVRGKPYFVSPAGNNANDGLSWATAKRSLWNVFDTVSDYDEIFVAAAEYDASHGWASRLMSRSASIVAVGGRAVFSRRVPSFTWAADANPGVFLGTPSSATAIGLMVDGLYPGPTGLPSRLIRTASLAECAATPGSFFASGTQVHVHLVDDRAPDAQVVGYFAGVNANVSADVNAYFEGIDFVGGNDCLQLAGTPAARSVVFNDCAFRFASNGDGLDIDAAGDYYLVNCIAEMCELDGLNYNQAAGGTAGPRVVEISCIARWNGYTAGGFNNGTTIHARSTAVSINCLTERNQNRNIHDVFDCRRWALGCISRDSRAADGSSANWVIGQIPGQSGAGVASSLWLDGCLSSGSLSDLVVNQNATCLTRNTPTGGWTISNIGTIGTY